MGTLPHSHEGDAERLSRIVETQRDIVAAAGDLDTVTRIEVLESSCSLTGADGAMLSFVEGADLVTHDALGIAERGKRRRPLESSVARHAIRSGRPLLIEDCDNDDRLDREMQRAIGDKSLICVPLFQGAHVVGALNVMSSPAGTQAHRGRPPDASRCCRWSCPRPSASAAEIEARRAQVEALARFRTALRRRVDRHRPLDREGHVVEVNPAVEEMLGYSAERARRRELPQLHAPATTSTTASRCSTR